MDGCQIQPLTHILLDLPTVLPNFITNKIDFIYTRHVKVAYYRDCHRPHSGHVRL
jgi:hypothetical protein